MHPVYALLRFVLNVRHWRTASFAVAEFQWAGCVTGQACLDCYIKEKAPLRVSFLDCCDILKTISLVVWKTICGQVKTDEKCNHCR